MAFTSEERFAVDHHPLVHEATPSARMIVHARGKLRLNLAWGDEYEFYDLASLTKIIFTTTALMQLSTSMGASAILNIPVRLTLPELGWPTNVAQHLKHQAGSDWWKPFYKQLVLVRDPYEQMEKMISLLRKEKLSTRNKKAVYSDFDFWVLGLMLGRWTGRDWTELWSRVLSQLPKNKMHFNPVTRLGSVEKNKVRRLLSKSSYAPTESCPWRNRILQGEVHDENAWSMGGVAPHAGLFGRAEDVSEWGLCLRAALLGKPNQLSLNLSTVTEFSKRSVPEKLGDWGLGFMKPTKGSASCGRYFSKESFGHTGFTGTSWWYDPKNDLMITLLANRVHPTRANTKHIEMRKILHDDAFQFCKSKNWI